MMPLISHKSAPQVATVCIPLRNREHEGRFVQQIYSTSVCNSRNAHLCLENTPNFRKKKLIRFGQRIRCVFFFTLIHKDETKFTKMLKLNFFLMCIHIFFWKHT